MEATTQTAAQINEAHLASSTATQSPSQASEADLTTSLMTQTHSQTGGAAGAPAVGLTMQRIWKVCFNTQH